MPKTPIKVLIRSRPTANFAHQNIQMDENTGYYHFYPGKSISPSPNLIKGTSIINKSHGGSSLIKYWSMLRKRSCSIWQLKISLFLLWRGTLGA